MHDAIGALETWSQPVRIQQVTFDQAKLRVIECTIQKLTFASGKIVNPYDRVAIEKQSVRQVAADKPSATSY